MSITVKSLKIMKRAVDQMIVYGDNDLLKFLSDCVITETMRPELAKALLSEVKSFEGRSDLTSSQRAKVYFLQGLAHEALLYQGAEYFINGVGVELADMLTDGSEANNHFRCARAKFEAAWACPLAHQHYVHLISVQHHLSEDPTVGRGLADIVSYLERIAEMGDSSPGLKLILAQSKFANLDVQKRAHYILSAHQQYQKSHCNIMPQYCLKLSELMIKLFADWSGKQHVPLLYAHRRLAKLSNPSLSQEALMDWKGSEYHQALAMLELDPTFGGEGGASLKVGLRVGMKRVQSQKDGRLPLPHYSSQATPLANMMKGCRHISVSDEIEHRALRV